MNAAHLRPGEPHRIVIVGGGAGGLELATRLGNTLGRRGKVEVTLIDKARTHVWKPKLHEIAADSMDMSAHEVALHGFAKVALDTLARLIVRRTEPHVKVH